MKNIFKMIGIIAFVAVIGFTMTACGDGGGGGNSNPAKLSIKNETSADIYVRIQNKTDFYTASPNNWVKIADNETKSWTIKGKGGSYMGFVDPIDLSLDNGNTTFKDQYDFDFETGVDSSKVTNKKIVKQGEYYKIEDL